MRATPDDCVHLTVEMVREIHAEAIAIFGGSDGVRELALLESAVAAPQASFSGKSPYSDLAEIAASYLYYLCKNHPFVDGNGRVARLMSHATLLETLDTGAVWSVARGLARNVRPTRVTWLPVTGRGATILMAVGT